MEEFKIILETEGGGGIGAAAGAPAGKGGGGGIAAALGGILKTLGPIAIAISILTQFRPLMSMIKGIMRILTEFLRPIADVIMIFLYPILQTLKPILQVVRQIIAPFRQIAYGLMAEAGKARAAGDMVGAAKLQGVAMSAMMMGVSATIMALFGEVLKLIISNIGISMMMLVDFIAQVLSVIFPKSAEKITEVSENIQASIQDSIEGASQMIDLGVAFAITSMGYAIETQLNLLGIDAPPMVVSAIDKIKGSFGRELDSLGLYVDKKLASIFRKAGKTITPSPPGVTGEPLPANKDYDYDIKKIGADKQVADILGK